MGRPNRAIVARVDDFSRQGLTLRPATLADVEAVLGLSRSIGAEFGVALSDTDLTGLPASYASRGGEFLVLEDGRGRVAGTLGLWALDEDTVELRKLYLVPTMRHAGLGRAALAWALARAADLGFRSMELESSRKFEAALALYDRFGFARTGKQPVGGGCDVHMHIDLPAAGPKHTDD